MLTQGSKLQGNFNNPRLQDLCLNPKVYYNTKCSPFLLLVVHTYYKNRMEGRNKET